MKHLKKIIFLVCIAIFSIAIVFVYSIFFEKQVKDSVVLNKTEYSLTFETEELACKNIYMPNKELYFVGSAVIDIENDGVDEFYITTGGGEKDCLFAFVNGKMVNIIDRVGIDSTQVSYGVFSVDITGNGFADIIVARKDGVYLYRNNNGIFTEQLLFNQFEENSVPVDVSVSDYDKDGDIDMYISTFIDAPFFKLASFNNEATRQKNIFLKNEGNLTFIDVTDEVGLALSQNTFFSSFVDLNNDTFEDLVVANNTDKIYIYENNGETFSLRSTPSGFGFWMGMSLSDYNQDGLVDLFLSNIGDTIPRKFLFGDLREDQLLDEQYVFLRNDGDFNFTNILPEISQNSNPFGWGIVANDFNFDNIDDYLIMHNYISWPPHKLKKSPGALLLVINNRLEQAINTSGLANDNFGFSSLIGDFNNDNLKDVVNINIDGSHILHLNSSTPAADSFVVRFESLPKYINITTELVFDDTDSIVKTLHRKQGIHSAQDSRIIFYYKNKTPKRVDIIASDKTILSSFPLKKGQTSLYVTD